MCSQWKDTFRQASSLKRYTHRSFSLFVSSGRELKWKLLIIIASGWITVILYNLKQGYHKQRNTDHIMTSTTDLFDL